MLADRLGHRFGRVITRANLAHIRLQQGQLAAAQVWAEEAMGLAAEAGLEGPYAIARATLADALRRQGHPAQAAEHALAAAKALTALGMPREAAETWEVVAACAEELGDRELSDAVLDATRPRLPEGTGAA